MASLKCKNCRELESALVMSNAILEWIQQVLDGEEVSDFGLSFPIVREVADLKYTGWRIRDIIP